MLLGEVEQRSSRLGMGRISTHVHVHDLPFAGGVARLGVADDPPVHEPYASVSLEVDRRQLQPDADLLGRVVVEAGGAVECVEGGRDRVCVIAARWAELDRHGSAFSYMTLRR